MAALFGLAALAVLGVAGAQSVATGRTAVGQLVPTDTQPTSLARRTRVYNRMRPLAT